MKKALKIFGIFWVGIVILSLVIYVFTPKEQIKQYEQEKQAKQEQEDSIYWQAGKVNIITDNAEEFLKAHLRNPDSYELVDTKCYQVDSIVPDEASFEVAIKYRAENGFGGMNLTTDVISVLVNDSAQRVTVLGIKK